MENHQPQNSEENLLPQVNHLVDSADLLKVIGNNKTYQRYLLLYYVIAQFFMMIIYTSIPFIFYAPNFVCINPDGTTYECSESEACTLENFKIESERVSVITKFELYCDRHYLQTVAKNIIFLVAAGGCFAMSIISDFIGRKPLFLIFSLLLIFGCLLGLQNNLAMVVIGTTMAILAQDIYFTFTYLYTNETVGADYRSRFLPTMQFFGSTGAIFSSIVSLWTNSYWHIFLFNLVVNGSLLIVFFYLVETPFILNKSRNKQKLFNALCYINEINNKDDPKEIENNKQTISGMIWDKNDVKALTINTTSTTQSKDDTKIPKKNHFMKEICSFHNILILIRVCFLFLNLFIILGLPLTAAQWIGNGNVQLNSTLFSLAQMLGFIYSFTHAHDIRRKRLMITFSFLTIVIPFLLILVNRLTVLGDNIKIWSDLALSVLLVGIAGITHSLISTYSSELFPTAIRGLGMGAGLYVGRSSFVISNYLTDLGRKYSVNPISFCFVQGTIALICACTLEETLNKKVKN